MIGEEVIKALAEDLDVTKSRAEDILLALKDLVAAELATGGRITLGPLGMFYMTQHKAVGFRASDALRKRLNATDVKLPAMFDRPLCARCHRRPVKVAYHKQQKCPGCIEAMRKARRREG